MLHLASPMDLQKADCSFAALVSFIQVLLLKVDDTVDDVIQSLLQLWTDRAIAAFPLHAGLYFLQPA